MTPSKALPPRDQVCRLLAYVVLATSEKTDVAVYASTYKQCSKQHQTSATVQIELQHIVQGIKPLLASLDLCCKVNATQHSPATASIVGRSLQVDYRVQLEMLNSILFPVLVFKTVILVEIYTNIIVHLLNLHQGECNHQE